jgi:hypothetical protein
MSEMLIFLKKHRALMLSLLTPLLVLFGTLFYWGEEKPLWFVLLVMALGAMSIYHHSLRKDSSKASWTAQESKRSEELLNVVFLLIGLAVVGFSLFVLFWGEA